MFAHCMRFMVSSKTTSNCYHTSKGHSESTSKLLYNYTQPIAYSIMRHPLYFSTIRYIGNANLYSMFNSAMDLENTMAWSDVELNLLKQE